MAPAYSKVTAAAGAAVALPANASLLRRSQHWLFTMPGDGVFATIKMSPYEALCISGVLGGFVVVGKYLRANSRRPISGGTAAGNARAKATASAAAKSRRFAASGGGGGDGGGGDNDDAVAGAAAAAAAAAAASKSQRKRTSMDEQFFKRLWRIVKIAIPSWRSKEFYHLCMLTAYLFSRTYVTIEMANIIGTMSKCLSQRNMHGVWQCMKYFFRISVPAALLNAGLKYESTMLQTCMRERLSLHVNASYIKGIKYYLASAMGAEHRIANVDQRLTDDIEGWCGEAASLYKNLVKPLLDGVVFTAKIGNQLGWAAPVLLYSYFALTSLGLKSISPPFGRYVSEIQARAGSYRAFQSRLITNAEEVAFLGGTDAEKSIAGRLLAYLFSMEKRNIISKFWFTIVETYLVKHGTAMMTFSLVAMPLYLESGSLAGADASDVASFYVKNMQLMRTLGNAISELVMTNKRFQTLGGYTARVAELLEALSLLDSTRIEFPLPSLVAADVAAYPPKVVLTGGGGGGGGGNAIRFEHVDVVSPEGVLLIRNLTAEIPAMTNVLVTGPNGAGKSSLFRVLGELWPLTCGTMHKPPRSKLFYIPQRPYLADGTFRAQILYPLPDRASGPGGAGDAFYDYARLEKCLELVQLRYLLDVHEWDDVKVWGDVLSGGEKQRIAIARLFFHRPQFAVLDECTSAVSVDVEAALYSLAKRMGITLFTISHRPQVRRWHDRELRLDGQGGYRFIDLTADAAELE